MIVVLLNHLLTHYKTLHSVSFLKKIQVKANKKCAITTDIRCSIKYVTYRVFAMYL